MNDLQNIIITSNQRIVIGCNYSNDLVINQEFNKVKCTKFTKLPCVNNEVFTKNINTLFVVNKYLRKIKESIKDNPKIFCRIILDHQLQSMITKGTYKYWVLNGTTESTNKKIDTLELETWRDFALLYSQVFYNVTFSSLNIYLSKNIQFNKQNIEFGQVVINTMYEEIKRNEQKALEELLNNN